MTLKIKYTKEENKITIGFGKESFEVFLNEDDSDKNTSWNTKEINSFLIKLSAATPEGEAIEVAAEELEEENKVFNHIVDLFKGFAEEYNR